MLNGRYNALLFSLGFHLIVLIILITAQFDIEPAPEVKQLPKAIKSFIYTPVITKTSAAVEKKQPPLLLPPTKKINTVNKQKQLTNSLKQTIPLTTPQPKDNKLSDNDHKPIQPLTKTLAKKPNKSLITESLVTKSIQSLRTSMAQKAINQGATDNYQEYLAQQQMITTSTSSNQPEELLKPINVDCNSGVKKGVLAVLLIVGSRITCSKVSSSAPYINKRLEKLRLNKPTKTTQY